VYEGWQPEIGNRVIVMATGRTGTIVSVGPDGDHLVCEVRYDRVPGRELERVLWSHAATELVPM
jgi:hypothetical protein